MAGVLNKTARQYNLKTVSQGTRFVVRLAPGFNVVEDAHWKAFEKDEYVLSLKKEGKVSFGAQEDDMELDVDPTVGAKSKSKADPVPKKKSNK